MEVSLAKFGVLNNYRYLSMEYVHELELFQHVNILVHLAE